MRYDKSDTNFETPIRYYGDRTDETTFNYKVVNAKRMNYKKATVSGGTTSICRMSSRFSLPTINNTKGVWDGKIFLKFKDDLQFGVFSIDLLR